MNKNSKLWTVLKGIIVENPVLVLVLGTCPALGVTNGIVSAVSMGLAAIFVLVCSNIVISLLRKIIPDTVRIPCYIVVIASFVTMVDLLLQSNDMLLPIHGLLGAWLPLLVVNCIILGRAEMFARKNKVIDSALDGLGMGIGFLLAIALMACIREILGSGAINLDKIGLGVISIPVLSDYHIPFLTDTAGGFLVYGILIAIVNAIGPKKGAEKRRNFSCEGCPSASICGRVSCSENAELAHAVKENTLVGDNNEEKEGV